MRIVYQLPPRLDAILDAFSSEQQLTTEGQELWHTIIQAKERCFDSTTPDDSDIEYSLLMNSTSEKMVYKLGYINYMGLTLYYSELKSLEAAWYHYAKAQHCLGLYDAWGKVLDHLVYKDQERQNRAKGGRQKNVKHTKILMDAFVKVANEKKPTQGWKSKDELVKAALPILHKIAEKNGPEIFPLYENIERTAYRWLKNGTEAFIAYMKNISLDNKDALD
jgi:hypothetical protein